MYHYIQPIEHSKFPKIKGLDIEGFQRQLNYFKKNFNFISPSNFINTMRKNNKLPDNAVLLTFDDGLKDHYQYVFPLLKKFNVQAMFFPSSQSIEDNIILDVHKIHLILALTENYKEITNKILDFVKIMRDFKLKSPESYYDELAKATRFDSSEVNFIKKMLQRELPKILRHTLVDNLFSELITTNEKSFSQEFYLSKDEIKEMLEEGMYFGSHSYSHEWLTLLSEDELNFELNKSLEFCNTMGLPKENLIFCYPYGDYNEVIIKKIYQKRFLAGLTTCLGEADLSKNVYKLPRFDTNDFPQ